MAKRKALTPPMLTALTAIKEAGEVEVGSLEARTISTSAVVGLINRGFVTGTTPAPWRAWCLTLEGHAYLEATPA